jgi:hypothetical protein
MLKTTSRSRHIKAMALAGVIAAVCLITFVRDEYERAERPLFCNIYGRSEHSFWPLPEWMEEPPVKLKNGGFVFADFDRNVLMIVREFVRGQWVSMVSTSPEMARFQLNKSAGQYVNIWARRNELLIVYDAGRYEAHVLQPGQARQLFDLLSSTNGAMCETVAASSSLDSDVKRVVQRFCNKVSAGAAGRDGTSKSDREAK